MESETFDTKTLAKAWAMKREAELSAQKVFRPKEKPLKISKVIQRLHFTVWPWLWALEKLRLSPIIAIPSC